MGDAEVEAIAAVGKAVRHADVIAWCRMIKFDVDAALKTGLIRVNLSCLCPTVRCGKLRCGRQEVISRIHGSSPMRASRTFRVRRWRGFRAARILGFLCR